MVDGLGKELILYLKTIDDLRTSGNLYQPFMLSTTNGPGTYNTEVEYLPCFRAWLHSTFGAQEVLEDPHY